MKYPLSKRPPFRYKKNKAADFFFDKGSGQNDGSQEEHLWKT